MKYIIRLESGYEGEKLPQYVADGGTYYFEGNKYVHTTYYSFEAKEYSSYAKAARAADHYQFTCVNANGSVQIISIP